MHCMSYEELLYPYHESMDKVINSIEVVDVSELALHIYIVGKQ